MNIRGRASTNPTDRHKGPWNPFLMFGCFFFSFIELIHWTGMGRLGLLRISVIATITSALGQWTVVPDTVPAFTLHLSIPALHHKAALLLRCHSVLSRPFVYIEPTLLHLLVFDSRGPKPELLELTGLKIRMHLQVYA